MAGDGNIDHQYLISQGVLNDSILNSVVYIACVELAPRCLWAVFSTLENAKAWLQKRTNDRLNYSFIQKFNLWSTYADDNDEKYGSPVTHYSIIEGRYYRR